MKVPNLLSMIRTELNRPDINLSAVQRAVPSLSYDSLLRIKAGSPHSPSWDTVHALSSLLLNERKLATVKKAAPTKPRRK